MSPVETLGCIDKYSKYKNTPPNDSKLFNSSKLSLPYHS